ncbi:MAG: helix-turn-helix domain-containing protein [Candidatus Sericytochromatia bacterium]
MVHRSELLHPQHFQTHYRRQAPSPALRPYVQTIWELQGYGQIPQGVAEHFLPDLGSRLVLPLGSVCLYQTPDSPLMSLSQAHVVGPQARTLACLHPASQRVLGVQFQPGALALLLRHLGLPQPGPTPLALPTLAELEQALKKGPDFGARSQMLTHWLTARFQAAEPPESWRLLAPALQALGREQPVQRTAAELGLAPRSLQRYCQQELGLSPRTCQRILRLRHSLSQRWQQGQSGLPAGYYDYAHFYREFRAFSGLSPQAYLAQFDAAYST